MGVDFAGKTFDLIDKLTGEITVIIVFVADLPYSRYIYVEGIISTAELQWITVNNHALEYFGGVSVIVVCDNGKQVVTSNKDWIAPALIRTTLPGKTITTPLSFVFGDTARNDHYLTDPRR